MRRPINAPYQITTEFGVADSYAKFGRHSSEWRDVEGYEGLYQVSDTGRLARLPVAGRTRNSKRVAYPLGSITKKGYLVYRLYDLEGSHKTIPAHRLVAKAFIPNPDSLPQVNHKNGDKLNNHLENLEWVTNEDNMAHAIKHGLVNTRGQYSGRAKFTEQQVRQVLETKGVIKSRVWAEKLDTTRKTIDGIRCGRRWRHIWEEYYA